MTDHDKAYLDGMRNGMTDLILAARESAEPLSFDLLERLAEGAIQAVADAMTVGGERCVMCGAIIPEGTQICLQCQWKIMGQPDGK